MLGLNQMQREMFTAVKKMHFTYFQSKTDGEIMYIWGIFYSTAKSPSSKGPHFIF